MRPGFFLSLGAAAAMGALPVLPALLAAALCHEAAHLAALRWFRVPVRRVSLTARGIEIEAPIQTRLSYGREMLAVAAGPLCNLLLALVSARLWGWYLFAGASFLLGAFNLLPSPALDGGRLLHLAVSRLWDPFLADRVCRVAGVLSAGLLTALLAALLLATGQGLLLLLGAAGLLVPAGRRRQAGESRLGLAKLGKKRYNSLVN